MATEVCLQARPADPKGALLIPSPLAWYRARFPTMLYYPARLVFCRLLYVLAMAAAFTAGASVKRTIDDQQGDSITGVVPVFLPSKAWNIGQTCTICAFRPNDPIDVSAVFDGTWHDTTHIGATDPKTIQINFTGHAVYVYHILPNYLIEGIVTSTNLAFYIDNEIVGLYNYTPTGTSPDTIPPIHYRVPVYANDSLVEGEHTLLIGASGETETLILFDYVVYTTEEDSEPAPSSSSSPSSSSHRSQISSSLASLPAPSSTSTRSSQSWTPSPYSANLSMFTSQPLPSESATMDQPSSQSQSPTSFHGSPTSSPRPEIRSGDHTAAIASSTAGGIALAMGIVVFCVLCRRRKLHVKRLQNFLSDKDTVDTLGTSSRMDLLGGPRGAIEVTETSLSERFADLVQQIKTLQSKVDGLRSARHGAKDDELGSPPALSAAEENISSTLMSLRAEMSALRMEMGERCVHVSPDVLPPSYQA